VWDQAVFGGFLLFLASAGENKCAISFGANYGYRRDGEVCRLKKRNENKHGASSRSQLKRDFQNGLLP
jgi:hypothetical protein